MKRKLGLILIFFTLVSCFPLIRINSNANNNTVISAYNPIIQTTNIPAPDFAIRDVDTETLYYLHDFAGKMVLLDFFATWCSYCKAELPYIYELHMMYPEDMLQIISIDVDNSETQSQVSRFRKQWNMDWIVGIDENRTIGNDYDVSGIPHLVLINETQHIVWEEIGFADYMWPDIKEAFAQYLPDDTTAPVINEFKADIVNEFSIFNPSITVFANVTEDRNIKVGQITYSIDGESKTVSATPTKNGDFWILNKTLEFSPEDLYSATTLTIQASFTDYFDNIVQSEEISVPIKHYDDTAAPAINDITVIVLDVDEDRYNLTVYAAIDEDLLLTSAKVNLLKEDVTEISFNLKPVNETYYRGSIMMWFKNGQPNEYTVKVVITDVAGNTAEQQTTINYGKTGSASYNGYITLVSMLFVTGVVYLIKKRKR